MMTNVNNEIEKENKCLMLYGTVHAGLEPA